MSDLVHETYLPFTRDQLREHFATVKSGAALEAAHMADPGLSQTYVDRHLRYYEESAARNKRWLEHTAGEPAPKAAPLDVQIEKDERFWIVTALMRAYHETNRVDALVPLLTRCLGEAPPLDGVDPHGNLWTWRSLLGASDAEPHGDSHLFFEANLPSPVAYKKWLRDHAADRVLSPTLRSISSRTANLEGTTKADAVLVVPSTGFCVIFEGKVNADISTSIRFDVLRNQLARCIDVMLEPPGADERSTTDARLTARRVDRTFLVVISPRIFKQHPDSRLYGHLLVAYRQGPHLLAQHLHHRADVDWGAVGRRLGWLTWEDLDEVLPAGLPWFVTPQE